MKVGDIITPQAENIFVIFQKKWIMSRSRDSIIGAPPSADFYSQNSVAHRVAKVIGDNEVFFQGLTLAIWPSEEFKIEVI
jgi:hypothetical protein